MSDENKGIERVTFSRSGITQAIIDTLHND